MGSNFKDAVGAARAAWLSSLTVVDKLWPVKQLHGLYRLLLKNREEILKLLGQGGQCQTAFLNDIELIDAIHRFPPRIAVLGKKNLRI